MTGDFIDSLRFKYSSLPNSWDSGAKHVCEIIEFHNCGHFPELEDSNRFVQLLKERSDP